MSTLSGGLVYEWTQETSDYGIVQENYNGTLSLLRDYNTLTTQYNKINITLITTQNETATNLQAPECKANLISNDGFSTDFDIPEPPRGAAALIANGVPDAPTGGIVSITETRVQVIVYDVNGVPLENLAIRPQTIANRPGSGSLSTGTPGASSTSSGLAPKATYVSGGMVAAAIFGAGMAVL